MPNRILREGILTSERFESLGWAEEVFYRRLMSVVDDFGRYYAKPALIRASCYPLLLNKVSDSDIEKWLTNCVNAALVRVYPALDGKRYLELLDFRQQVRATASKYPAFDSSCVADAQQVIRNCTAPAHLDVSVSGVVSATPSAAPKVDRFEEFWKAYPKKKAKDDAKKAFDKRKPDQQLLGQMLAAIEVQSASDDWMKDGGQFIPYPASWLNAGRWADDSGEPAKQGGIMAGAI